jgi:hypothetical protein
LFEDGQRDLLLYRVRAFHWRFYRHFLIIPEGLK